MGRRWRPVDAVRRLSDECALDILFQRCVLIMRYPVSGVLLGAIKHGHRSEWWKHLPAGRLYPDATRHILQYWKQYKIVKIA